MPLDLAKVREQAASVASPAEAEYPREVPGRVAHIDADFMAYQVSAETKAELDELDPTPRKTLEDMKHNAYAAVTHIRRMAAAPRAVLHVTRAETKGGRTEQAMLKPYQANRADRSNRPEHLDVIRDFLGGGCPGYSALELEGIIWTMQEADDGMAQAAYADPENAVVCSADKDLLMVPGWKLDMYTNVIRQDKDAFGWIDLDRSKSSAKVIGGGTKFFWAQCLMGDTADNISGIPEVPGIMWQQYAGTAAYRDTYGQWIASECPSPRKVMLSEKLKKMTAKTKKCGPVLTYDLLKDARSDKECFETVKACYTLLAKDHGYEFTNYRDGTTITPTQALLSEMKLLWMRRKPDPNDVLHWLKETLK